MASADYTPIDEFPDLDGGGGDGPLKFQSSGDVLGSYQTWRADYNIAGVTNTTPVKITTTVTNKYVTGQKVIVEGTGVSTVDGTWNSITVISGTQFSLDGSVAGGAAGAGGRVYDPKQGLFGKLVDGLWYLGKRLLGTAYSTGIISIQGRKALTRPRVSVGTSGGTFKVTDGDVFELNPTPGGSAVVILSSTSPTPTAQETMLFVAPGLLNVNSYQFQRADTTVIATMYGTALQNTCPSASFEFSGGVWRLGANSGWVQAETQGVLAGPGA